MATNMNELLTQYNLSQTEFAHKFEIPLRTVQNWATNKRNPPDYILKLIEYRLKNEKNSD